MITITLTLFFLPLLNGLVGGVVGGYKAGSVRKALGAAVMPGVVVAVGLWLTLVLFSAPFWGLLAGTSVLGAIVLAEIGMFGGAALGGAAHQLGWGEARATT